MQLCLCGSNQPYTTCCEVFINGQTIAPTPEALMRSRYTAYAQSNVDYIAATMKEEAAKDFNAEATKIWAQHTKWLGLEVLQATPVTTETKVGFVEFIAHYIFNNKKENIHEVSEFHQENDRWYYVDGKHTDTANSPGDSIKIGRNDICPCGSGKKYKKCCG